MAKLKTWLAALLAAQLILAGSLLAFNYQRTGSNNVIALYDSNAITIDRMEIGDGEQSIVVAKEGDAWVLPGNQNLPVTESKINATLDSVAEVDMVWPVSTTGSSHKRFEVADDNFQREIKLFAGEDLVAHFYLGTSPGFRKVHLRQANADEVYAAALNTFDFPVVMDEWLEKGLLNVADATAIIGPNFSLQKEGDDWNFVEGTTEATLNMDKAQQLALAFSNFRVTDIADAAPQGEALSFTVTAAEESYDFNFYAGEEETFFVNREDIAQIFTLSKYDFERIANVSLDILTIETTTTETETESAEVDISVIE